MITKSLAPILDKDSYSDPIAYEIEFYWWDLIFRPLFELLEMDHFENQKLDNSRASLKAALKFGRVRYEDGYFVGEFSAAISKTIRSMGGTFNKAKKAFKLPLAKMTVDIRQAVADAVQREGTSIKQLKDLVAQADQTYKNLSYKLNFGERLNPVFSDLDKQFKKTTADSLVVTPDLPKKFRQVIESEYTENMNLYIKNWTEEEIVKLRQVVEENTMSGFRAEKLKAVIRNEFGQAQRKAKFLARQETSLLVSKYRQTRYEDAGVQSYRWDTSHDSRVRPDHKELNGRIFSWDSPPVTDRATGARNHPGEDFGCRCVAIPILRTIKK